MKKLLTVLLVALLVVTMAVAASAELYSPDYYGVLKTDATITIDGAVDEAYGEPIFYFVADGTDDPGEYTQGYNWFFTRDTSENLDDVLALVQVTENYAKGYAVWTDTALYLCIDTNILGWNYPEGLAAQYMWQAFCVQLGIFDFETGDNTDYGLAIDMAGNTIQRNFKQNKNPSAPSKDFPILNTLIDPNGLDDNDQVELNAKVTRDGANVIYEVELPFATALSFIPQEGDCMGLDICVNFGECESADEAGKGVGTVQKCLTFVNKGSANGFHTRDINFARPLYFVTNKDDAAALQSAKVNAGELAADEDGYSISLFGCNEVPEGTNFVLEETDKKAGFGSLFLTVKNGEANINRWAIPAVDGTGFDTLEFDMYVSDLAIFDLDSGNQFELTSGGKEDAEEVSWNMAKIKEQNQGGDLVVGWNHIVLPIPADSALNIANVNFMGFYFSPAPTLENNVGIMLDNFRLSRAQAILAEEAQEDAADVDEKIGKLDEITADNYTKMEIKVRGARAAYDGLSDLAKTFVNADMLAKLETAEKAIADFKANPPADDDEKDPEQPGTEQPGTEQPGTTDPEPQQPGTTTPDTSDKKDDGGNMGLIIGIVVGAVALVAVVVVVIVVSKKKK